MPARLRTTRVRRGANRCTSPSLGLVRGERLHEFVNPEAKNRSPPERTSATSIGTRASAMPNARGSCSIRVGAAGIRIVHPDSTVKTSANGVGVRAIIATGPRMRGQAMGPAARATARRYLRASMKFRLATPGVRPV